MTEDFSRRHRGRFPHFLPSPLTQPLSPNWEAFIKKRVGEKLVEGHEGAFGTRLVGRWVGPRLARPLSKSGG